MIIGVEGGVHTGKTTFINNFVKDNEDFQIVPECKFDELLSDYDRQLYYLEQERSKKKNYPAGNLILDRTILSTLCYTLFCLELSREEKERLVSVILQDFDDNKYILCDKMVYIVYDWEGVKSNHKVLKKDKHTQDVLVDNSYLKFYQNLFDVWCSGVQVLSKYTIQDRLITVFDGREVFANVQRFLKEGIWYTFI